MKAALGPTRSPAGVRNRLPDTGRDSHSGLRSRGRPVPRPYQGARLSRTRRLEHGGEPRDRRGLVHLEVLSAAESVIGRPVPRELSRNIRAIRSPSSPNQRAKDLLGSIPSSNYIEVLRSAWSWHSNHLDGYGDESAPQASRLDNSSRSALIVGASGSRHAMRVPGIAFERPVLHELRRQRAGVGVGTWFVFSVHRGPARLSS